MNLFLALVLIGLFVAPTTYQLLHHLRTRTARDLSLLAHSWRHAAAVLFRLGLIVGAYLIVSEHPTAMAAYLAVFVLCAANIAASITDRRLVINATTGLATFKKMSLPLPAGLRATYIDDMGPRTYKDQRTFDAWGMVTLKRHYTVNYNGSVSSSGNYSERTLARFVASASTYLREFRKHDTPADKEQRTRFKQEREAKLAPRRARVQARALKATQKAEGAKARQVEEAKAKQAKIEDKRRGAIADKFRK